MKPLILIMAMSLAAATHSQSTEDVIYKTDGSILRGTIIEQDFTNQRYRIQLQGGSIFGVAESDIQKITKEPIFKAQIAAEPQQLPTPEAVTASSFTPVPTPQKIATHQGIDSVLYIGPMGHNLYYPIENTYQEIEKVERYKGLRLGMENILSEHIAARFGLEGGSLSSIQLIDSDNDVIDELPTTFERDYLGLDATLVLSTNLQKGWQFNTGLGLFSHTYVTDSESEHFSGSHLELGVGYSWQSVQLAVHGRAMLGSDYPDEIDGQSSVSLQLGFNFQ